MHTKLTLFLLYLLLFRPLRWLRISVYIGATLNVVFYIVDVILVVALQVPGPGESFQEHTLKSQGLQVQNAILYTTAVGVAFDIFLLVLPIRAAATLQLPRRQKVGVVIIFLTGLL